jgi:hypothetical protein
LNTQVLLGIHFKRFYVKFKILKNNQKIISPTRNTPEVILDEKGTIKFTGRLIPENAEDFFNPIEVWINEYFQRPAEITCVEIRLEYINSVGSKFLLNILHIITHIHLNKDKKRFVIRWYYRDEDEDILELGKFLSSDLDVPFDYIKII